MADDYGAVAHLTCMNCSSFMVEMICTQGNLKQILCFLPHWCLEFFQKHADSITFMYMYSELYDYCIHALYATHVFLTCANFREMQADDEAVEKCFTK